MDELNEQETTPAVQDPAGLSETDSSAPDTTPEADPFDSGADTFDRPYVERLRKESASYRTKAKEFESYAQAFEPYSDDDRAVWQEAMRRFHEDPKSGAEYLDAIAKAVLAEYNEASQEANVDGGDGSDEPLTRAQLDSIFAEREAQAEQAREIARIESEAKELGYDPASDEYTYLLTVASRLPSGSLKEAHEKIEASYQARIDAYVAKKAQEAEGSPTPPADAGYAPSGERPLKTWADADAAFRARLAAERAR